MLATTTKMYRIHFIRKGSVNDFKPVKVVLSLGAYFPPQKVAKGLHMMLEHEPTKVFTATSGSGHVAVFNATQIDYFDVKPYEQPSKDEKLLDLSPQEKSRLINYITD